MVAQRRQEIEAKLQEQLRGDREGFTLASARLTDNFNAVTRGAAARARGLEEDAFKATLFEQQRALSARAANGDAEAVRDWGELLRLSEGRLSRVDLAQFNQRFQGDVDSAHALRLVRDNPAAAVRALADPRQFPSLDAAARERLINSATSRQQAQATMAYTNALRQDAAQRRANETASNAAEKDLADALIAGDTAAAQAALGRLRPVASGETYDRWASRVRDGRADIPTTPLMEAAIANRLQEYDSGNQVATVGGLLTLAHGLPAVPTKFESYIVCSTAEQNWAVNDVVPFGASYLDYNGANHCGWAIYADATNVYVRFHATTAFPVLINKTSGAPFTPTLANWRYRVKAS
jgi:hypothetical protein